MQIIPLEAIASQRLSVVLNEQACQIRVYQRSTGVYLDLYANGMPIIQGSRCPDRVKLVRQPYLGFLGDLAFLDTQGNADPDFAEFGTRYFLIYLPPDEV